MTVVLTPYWSNGIQKLKVVPQPSPPPPQGLAPPVFDPTIHTKRCLAQLRSKDQDIEKYIYLAHLKEVDPDLFYKLCLNNMTEFTPIIYTPTVGDACLQFSHIYRKAEGLVSFFSGCFSIMYRADIQRPPVRLYKRQR